MPQYPRSGTGSNTRSTPNNHDYNNNNNNNNNNNKSKNNNNNNNYNFTKILLSPVRTGQLLLILFITKIYQKKTTTYPANYSKI